MPVQTPSGLARRERLVAARAIAHEHGGVAHRQALRDAGLAHHHIRVEISRGTWWAAGRHTVAMVPKLVGEALAWRAVWESGSGAVLGGASALVASGMRGFTCSVMDVCVPTSTTRWPRDLPGVRVRRVTMPPVVTTGIPRIEPVAATIQAARWASSDRQAALLVCLAVQQRLVAVDRLLAGWSEAGRGARKRFLDQVFRDVCDGAQSLGELDFGQLSRRYGLPSPSRQTLERGPRGRIYLDVRWKGIGLVVEIDGVGHTWGLATVEDALRQNAVTLRQGTVLRIPVLGLRTDPDLFMGQVRQAHRDLTARQGRTRRFDVVEVGADADFDHIERPGARQPMSRRR